MRTWLRSPAVIAGLLGVLVTLVSPASAEAQRRGRRGPAGHTSIVVGAAHSPFWFYGQWYPYPWGPYGPYPPGYWYPAFDVASSIRIRATPRQAEVYVDGSRAGTVDDFDGIFQRLHVEPGAHEIALYLPGYRTVREERYFGPRSSHTIEVVMERLAEGETSGPPPSPAPRPPDAGPGTDLRRGAPPRRLPPYEPTEASAAYGSLAIRVQPADAEILLDGKPWSVPAGAELITIRATEGRHRIEIRKDGYAPFVEDVMVRRGRTLTLNVSLRRSGVSH